MTPDPGFPRYDGRRYQLERPGEAPRTLIPLADVARTLALDSVALRNYLRDHTHLRLEKFILHDPERPGLGPTLLVLDDHDLPTLYRSVRGVALPSRTAGGLTPRPAVRAGPNLLPPCSAHPSRDATR